MACSFESNCDKGLIFYELFLSPFRHFLRYIAIRRSLGFPWLSGAHKKNRWDRRLGRKGETSNF